MQFANTTVNIKAVLVVNSAIPSVLNGYKWAYNHRGDRFN